MEEDRPAAPSPQKKQKTIKANKKIKKALIITNRDDKDELNEPKRPLSAYNFFFRERRAELLDLNVGDYDPNVRVKRLHQRTHGRMPFVTMVKTISAMWKELPAEERKKYEDLAAADNIRYYNEMNQQLQTKTNTNQTLQCSTFPGESLDDITRWTPSNHLALTSNQSHRNLLDERKINFIDTKESQIRRQPNEGNHMSPGLSVQQLQLILDQRDRQWLAYLQQEQLIEQQTRFVQQQHPLLQNNPNRSGSLSGSNFMYSSLTSPNRSRFQQPTLASVSGGTLLGSNSTYSSLMNPTSRIQRQTSIDSLRTSSLLCNHNMNMNILPTMTARDRSILQLERPAQATQNGRNHFAQTQYIRPPHVGSAIVDSTVMSSAAAVAAPSRLHTLATSSLLREHMSLPTPESDACVNRYDKARRSSKDCSD